MMTLDAIQKKLQDIRARKAVPQRAIEDQARPHKLLREIEAEEAAALAEQAQFDEHVAHLESQLLTHQEFIADWTPFEPQMPGTIAMLEAIEDGKVLRNAGGLTQGTVNRLKVEFIALLEQLAFRRERVIEIKAELKKLGVK